MLQCPAAWYDDLGQAIFLKSKQIASSSLDMDESELEQVSLCHQQHSRIVQKVVLLNKHHLQIRKARLEQLKAQGGGGGGGGGARSGGGSGQEERQRQ